jgi:type II restriction/modification system DNA methylase subunit YeeA
MNSSITLKMRENADNFATYWNKETSERAESQSFINKFFEIFELDRKDYAQFEKPVRRNNGQGTGFIDLYWSGKLIIEAKSAIKDSEKDWANTLEQAEKYVRELGESQRPRYILLINFKKFRKYTVENHKDSSKIKTHFNKEIELKNLANELDEFSFFPEFANQLEEAEEKINQEAARLIANVYETIERKGYDQNDIAVFLARLMFCMFAEDTGIFDLKQFENFLRYNTTSENLGEKLKSFFNVLNTSPELRKKNDDVIRKFPYVNGGLFKDNIDKLPILNTAFRELLIKCCEYDWSFISPVIFGSLFQDVTHDEDRRTLGAHYTSEKNIMKVVKPLFLDELRQEFENVKTNVKQLEKFRNKLRELRFLDPACGCGNFLVVIYRELRLLDIEIIRLQSNKNLVLDVSILGNVQLTNFYGYEIDKTSAMIAEVAMWLTEHQMNMRLENEFGKTIPTIPLKEAANIKRCNALDINWTTDIKGKYFDYILGNPPFIGSKMMKQSQRDQIVQQFDNASGSGVLDYVTGWYIKAAKYIQGANTRVAFVSTNSIVQGEQTSILWGQMLNNYRIKIHFAHRTFKWSNEAKGNAAVYCIIVGFANFDTTNKSIFDYEDIKGEPQEIKVKNINPYLVDAKDIILTSRSKPLSKVPQISKGNQPTDGGNLILTEKEKDEFINKNKELSKYVKKLVGAEEFIHNKLRYCLWLVNALPNELRNSKELLHRLELVKKMRVNSTDPKTRQLANTPWLFRETKNYSSFVIVPSTTSENRKYIPMGFGDNTIIPTNLLLIIPNATLYHFGVLTSTMHMAWVKYVCGRLENRFRYSKDIVYNNFPWAENPTEKHIKSIESLAQKILEVRLQFPDSSLADLYDSSTMPTSLMKAHDELDKAVDLAYRPQPFTSEANRMVFLFELYEKYTADLFTENKKKKK